MDRRSSGSKHINNKDTERKAKTRWAVFLFLNLPIAPKELRIKFLPSKLLLMAHKRLARIWNCQCFNFPKCCIGLLSLHSIKSCERFKWCTKIFAARNCQSLKKKKLAETLEIQDQFLYFVCLYPFKIYEHSHHTNHYMSFLEL